MNHHEKFIALFNYLCPICSLNLKHYFSNNLNNYFCENGHFSCRYSHFSMSIMFNNVNFDIKNNKTTIYPSQHSTKPQLVVDSVPTQFSKESIESFINIIETFQ